MGAWALHMYVTFFSYCLLTDSSHYNHSISYYLQRTTTCNAIGISTSPCGVFPHNQIEANIPELITWGESFLVNENEKLVVV